MTFARTINVGHERHGDSSIQPRCRAGTTMDRDWHSLKQLSARMLNLGIANFKDRAASP